MKDKMRHKNWGESKTRPNQSLMWRNLWGTYIINDHQFLLDIENIVFWHHLPVLVFTVFRFSVNIYSSMFGNYSVLLSLSFDYSQNSSRLSGKWIPSENKIFTIFYHHRRFFPHPASFSDFRPSYKAYKN